MPKARRTKLLVDMVWPEHAGLTGFAQKFAQYGTDHEDIARQVYMADRSSRCLPEYADPRFSLEETGLMVNVEHGWLGSSPDFVVNEPRGARPLPSVSPVNSHHLHDPYVVEHPMGFRSFLSTFPVSSIVPTAGEGVEWVQGCGEIKCPAAAAKVLYSSQAQHSKYGFPEYYYDQIQGAMSLNNWSFCDVVVYTPTKTEVTRFFKDDEYWTGTLFPALRSFYFNEFLPALQLRVDGKLEPGTLAVATPGIPRQIPTKKRQQCEGRTPVIDNPMDWFSGAVIPDVAMVMEDVGPAAAAPAPIAPVPRAATLHSFFAFKK